MMRCSVLVRCGSGGGHRHRQQHVDEERGDDATIVLCKVLWTV